MPKLLFLVLRPLQMLLLSVTSLALLSACGGEFDEIKDTFDGTKSLFGAIGFKAGADAVISPGDTACGAAVSTTGNTAASTTGSAQTAGRCFSEAEAVNAIASQCLDCKVVLTFKATNEKTYCGSIALTGSKLLYGVGSGATVTAAQESAMLACMAAEGAVNPTTCTPSKTRCL